MARTKIDPLTKFFVNMLLTCFPAPREREAKKTGRQAVVTMKPVPGYAWNPLRQFPQNRLCFCGSRTKFKNCCREFLEEAVEEEKAKWLTDHWEDILAGRVRFAEAPKKPSDPWSDLPLRDSNS